MDTRVCTFFLFLFCFWVITTPAVGAQPYVTSNEVCHGFKAIPSLKSKGKCVGLVADKTQIPWKMPRKLLFDGPYLYVTATGGWDPQKGQLWRLQIKNGAVVADLLYSQLDRVHGIQKGPDGFIYIGEAKKVSRFHPNEPLKLIPVIHELPDNYTNAKGIATPSNHPLTEFIILPTKDLVVNVGAPSNDCTEEYLATRACAQRDQQAEVRIYFFDNSTQAYNTNYKVLARGLRNSMGLLYNESLNQIIQAENSADALGTPDEINLIHLDAFFKGRSYDFGWPFCFGFKNVYSPYKNFKRFCETRADNPFLLLPAHSAPLDMKRYQGALFSEYNGSVLIALHGHRPSGSKLAVLKTNADGSLKNAPIEYVFDSGEARPQQNPKVRPVGIAFDSDGAIFMVDDVNGALLVIAKDESGKIESGEKNKNLEVVLKQSTEQKALWSKIYSQTFKTMKCQTCHSDIVKNTSDDTLKEMLRNGWVVPSEKLENQVLWLRMTGQNGLRIMPPPPAITINSKGSEALKIDLQKWLLLAK